MIVSPVYLCIFGSKRCHMMNEWLTRPIKFLNFFNLNHKEAFWGKNVGNTFILIVIHNF